MTHIALYPVTSSQISEMGHAGDIMAVRFSNGALWHYQPVTHEEFQNLRNAPSLGKAFNQFKRNHAHTETRIE